MKRALNDESYKADQLRRSGQYSEAVARFENIEGILAEHESESNINSNSWMTLFYAVLPLAVVVIAICLIFIKKKKDERTV
jgi:hypothetical protein